MSGIHDVDPAKALIWLPFRTQYADGGGDRVTDNYGRLAASPTTVTMGDGVTPASYPVQMVGTRGVSLDGAAQYVDLGLVDTFERDDAFSVMCACTVPDWQTAGRPTDVIWAWEDINQANRGAQLFIWDPDADGPWEYEARLVSTIGVSEIRVQYDSAYQAGFRTVAITYDGSSTAAGLRLFENTIELSRNVVSDTLAGTILSGKSFLYGARWNAAAIWNFCAMSRSSFFGVFPWELSQAQIQWLHERCVREVMTP